jgi:hypothetical protein
MIPAIIPDAAALALGRYTLTYEALEGELAGLLLVACGECSDPRRVLRVIDALPFRGKIDQFAAQIRLFDTDLCDRTASVNLTGTEAARIRHTTAAARSIVLRLRKANDIRNGLVHNGGELSASSDEIAAYVTGMVGLMVDCRFLTSELRDLFRSLAEAAVRQTLRSEVAA